jgi:hypothetical protein
MESFLWGLSASALIGLSFRMYYMRKEARGIVTWVEMRGQFRGYGARILLFRDSYREYVRMSAPENPEERIIVPISGSEELLGAPAWKKMRGEEGKVMLLGESYTIRYMPQGMTMDG